MHKTPDETKRNIVTCMELNMEHFMPGATQKTLGDALACIKKLEAELEDMTARYKIADDCAKKKGEMNEKLYAELTAVKAERDAAVESMRSDPHCCYHCANMTKRGICQSEPRADGHCFEWRGVQKEESDDGKE